MFLMRLFLGDKMRNWSFHETSKTVVLRNQESQILRIPMAQYLFSGTRKARALCVEDTASEESCSQ